jgi:hypothetical protein
MDDTCKEIKMIRKRIDEGRLPVYSYCVKGSHGSASLG